MKNPHLAVTAVFGAVLFTVGCAQSYDSTLAEQPSEELVVDDVARPATPVTSFTLGPVAVNGLPATEPVVEPVDSGTPAEPDAGSPMTVEPDAGQPEPIDAGPPVTPVTPVTPSAWLFTQGNRILNADGSRWRGRGANLHDTRSCGACSGDAPVVAEVLRRMDMLVDDWKANFIRLDLETNGGQTSFTSDAQYLADIHTIVDHAKTKPGLYVMLTLWIDPTFSSQGWPTAATTAKWQVLANEFKNEPRVLFGLVNEPQSNQNGAQDAQVWTAMNNTVQAIRDIEGTGPKHLIAVQGTRSWARVLDYYVTRPITAGGGANVLYETHVYDPASQFAALFENPARTLPVIIGEFGPASGLMSENDCLQLMQRARAIDVPHLAWTFHQRCPPNLIEETAPGCGVNMPLRPTSWGTLFKNQLALPW